MTVTVQSQQTLGNRISCTGVGLHSGAKVSMTLHPGEPDTGIVFRRADVAGDKADIQALYSNVVDTRLCSTIGNEHGTRIALVEHLMAALMGCGVDNAVIEVDGPEVPIMDGSSAPFVFLVECAGLKSQATPRQAIRILKTVEARDGNRVATLSPAPEFSVRFEIEFDNDLISHQACSFQPLNGSFKDHLCRARTFGFLEDGEELRALGFARGASLDNAVVISGDRVLNEDGLRYQDEFVRHKALDSMGDLYLAGAPFVGLFTGVRSGHALHNTLLRALFADGDAWCYEADNPVYIEEPPATWEQPPALATA